MISRQKLLDAAARVYGEYGFRGATTRRIADEAGVNEVTLFRLFGSKAALIEEALREHVPRPPQAVALPEQPGDPHGELTDWCARQLTELRTHRSVIRKAMAEMEEHPEVGPCVGEGTTCAFTDLRSYARKLHGNGAPLSEKELHAAVTMLISALFADAMVREFMPDTYPQPETDAPELYATMFLRALGAQPRPNDRSTGNGARERTPVRGGRAHP
jgi:AcrR family transcriptional regulator